MPTPANRQEFAALVNDARCRQHLSIRGVARIADVPPTTAQGWLNGKHFPTPALRGNFLRLVEHLDLMGAVPRDLWDDSWEALGPALRSGRSPYLGLRPFRTSDRALFFGRSEQSARLAAAVRELAEDPGHGMLALVGPSGSGKSSLLAAGLLGRELDADGALAGWSGSYVTVLRLLADPDLDVGDEPGRRLVVVDQVEDALALPSEPRRRFLAALAALAERAVVVLGVRSDAFGAAAAEGVLEAAMSRPILLPPMTREAFREVIVLPAESAGVSVDPDLVRVLLNELAPATRERISAGALPLLSNALLLIWAVGNGRRLTLDDYHTVGGVAGAVERLAEQVYLSLDPAQQAAAERLFLRLVRIAGDDLVRETLPLAEVDATTRPAMEAFVAARMLTTVDEEVRISHQALLSHWGRLVEWLAEYHDDLVVMEKLRSAAEVWLASGRQPEALLPVRQLQVFAPLLDRSTPKRLLTDVERAFVAASDDHFSRTGDVARTDLQHLAGRLARWRILTAVVAGIALGLAVVLVAALRP